MIKIRLFTLLGLLMTAIQLSAQEQFVYAESVSVEAGQEAEIVVKMDLDLEPYEKVCVCFFLLQFPAGIEFANSEVPTSSCTLSAELVGELDESLIQKSFKVYDNYGGDGKSLFYLDLNKCSSALKGSHGELMRVSVRSTLGEALTFTPQISFVHIADDKGLPFVTDGVREKRPDYNTLYIDDMEACTGDELTLSVKMTNKVPCEAFSFLMLIPGGTSFVKDDEGNPLANLSYERISPSDIEIFEVTLKDNHLLRVLVATNGTPFSGNDGEVFTVRIRIDETLKVGFNSIMLYDISVADVNAVSYDIDMKSVHLNVSGLRRGDANGDGNLTVADLVAISHHVMDNTPTGFSATAADANRDGQVNVADYTAVAHLLLYGNIERPAEAQGFFHESSATPLAAMMESAQPSEVCSMVLPSKTDDNSLYLAPAKVTAGGEAVLSVRMRNAVDVEGLQFSLSLPEGMSVVRDDDGLAGVCLSNDRTTAERTNTFATSILPDGTLKVMAASTKGAAIPAGDGEVCTVRVRVDDGMDEGDYALLLSDVAIGDNHAKSCGVTTQEAMLTVDEVSAIDDARLPALTSHPSPQSYDLQGRQAVSGKGLVIRDGRKYMR